MAIILVNRYQKVVRADRRFGKPWLGHKFHNGEDTVHELRCWICGDWFNYSKKDAERLKSQGRWDYAKQRAKHCGSEHCQEWNRRYEAHQARVADESRDYHVALFKRLRKKGLVA